jgi:2-oxoglutarate dehydrogenase dihydrolipoamide succinyltransferase (E2 component)
MPTEVIMPQLGESVVEGTLTRWLKQKGDRVDEYEPLLEVNTDKVDSEIPSPAAGILLDILVPEGTTINAGTVLAFIGEEGEELAQDGKPEAPEASPAPQPAAEKAAPAAEAAPTPTAAHAAGRDRDLGFISPVVARMAGEHNIDLYQVAGTGRGGRITKKDLLEYLERQPAVEEAGAQTALSAQPAPADQPAPAAQPAARPAAPAQAPQPQPTAGELMPLNTVRRAIAEHMVMSKRTSPHVTTVMEADLSRITAHRQANKAGFERDGVNLTFTAYFVAAATAALRAYPIVNSSWSEEGIVLHKDINIGMATSLGEAGLIVPVIKNADNLSLLGVARAVNDLAYRARNRQLKPDEVRGGTFSITNHGITGSLFATPIINQPQCGILGVGAIQKRVVVIDDAIAIRPMAYLTLTFDHRILDGAVGDYFLGKVVESLQNWS